jgi:hypothetical protein
MRFAFDKRLAGLLLAIGLAMSEEVTYARRWLRLRLKSGGGDKSPEDWIDDPGAFAAVARAAIALLEAARPRQDGDVRPEPPLLFSLARRYGLPVPPKPKLIPALSAKEGEAIEAIVELLGPVAERMANVVKVRDAMAARIAMGEWKPNTRIPNEDDIAREFGVSLETTRAALDLMEVERLLTRRAENDTSDQGVPIQRTFNVQGSEPAVEVQRDSSTGAPVKVKKGRPSTFLDQKAVREGEARVTHGKARKSRAGHSV